MEGWFNKKVQNATATAGNVTGGAVNAFGNGVAGAGTYLGNGITKATLSWGQALREYGNNIKDATGATGARAATDQNPLAIAKTPTSVKLENERKRAKKKKQTGGDPLGISGKF